MSAIRGELSTIKDGNRPSARGRPKKKTPGWAVIGVLSLCGTAVALQLTMVVPLLPDFPEILDVSSDEASWLVTATLLTSAVATPVMSRLADMFGKRLMMILCLFAMTLGSVVTAVGGGYPTVIIGRSLQGFAAALIPIGISIMRDELPRERVGSAVALMSATLGIGSAMGLTLSGVIYESLGWQAIFWTSAAAGAVLTLAVLTLVSESSVRTKGRFDYVGTALLTVALIALLLAISKGGTWGWSSQPIVVLFVVTVGALLIWFPYELRVGQPLVDLRTSARRAVLLTNIASLLVGFAMFANLLLTTQQLQLPQGTGYGFGLPVITAGLAMLPSGVAMVLFAPVSGRLINKRGGRITLITGAAVLGLAYVFRVFVSGSLPTVIAGSTLVSIGTAISYAAMPTLIMGAVPITETASANGLNSLLRAIGTSISSAAVAVILGSVTVRVGGATLPSFAAFQDVFWVAGLSALAACAVAFFIPAQLRPPPPSADPVETQTHSSASNSGNDRQFVIRGRILRADHQPIYPAVVTVMNLDGTAVDWSRADSNGTYSVALPGPGRYLVLANGQGWTPKAEVLQFDDETTGQQITLTQRLSLSGVVRRDNILLAGTLVALSEATGGVVRSTRTDDRGWYSMPLPRAGRYIVTALEPDTFRAHPRKVILDVRSATVDVDISSADRMDAGCTGPLKSEAREQN